MTETPDNSCPRCGAVISADAMGGLCPRCLMAINFDSLTATVGGQPPLSTPLTPEELAETFPQYDIFECLGRGGMGVVYKARQKSLDRLVAIKILPPERVGEAAFSVRFASEASTLAKLSHPNIVTVHDFGESGGFYYIVMEYVDGVNLRDLLRDGNLEPDQALAIVPPICDALQYAHGKGIVHRDIKPENLLLDREGRVKIADFGIASLVGANGEPAGTPPYMAPEQVSRAATDPRTDIFALGVVLYEMLTGQRPDKELVAPSRRVRIDVRLDEMVLRALEVEPERRYQSAEEFRTAVETVRGQAALLKTGRCLFATPDYLATVRGAMKLHEGLGLLSLFSDRLEFRTGMVNTTIPLSSIRRLDLVRYPILQSPAGLRSLEVEYGEDGTKRRLLLTPVRGRFLLANAARRRATEWKAEIEDAVRSAHGEAPASSSSPVVYQGFSLAGKWCSSLVLPLSLAVVLAILSVKQGWLPLRSRDGFRHAKSLTVPDPTIGSACLLDFESGRLLVPPDDLARKIVSGTSRLDSENLRWLTESGADAAVHMPVSPERPGLRIFGGTAFTFSRNQNPGLKFDDFRPDDVRAAFHLFSSGRPHAPVEGDSFFHVASSPRPSAMAFVTREGSMGVLEILGLENDPPGVKIRYKLVDGPAPHSRSLTPPPPGEGKPSAASPSLPPPNDDVASHDVESPPPPADSANLKPIPDKALRAFEEYIRFHQETLPRDLQRSGVEAKRRTLEGRWKESLRGTVCHPLLDQMERLAQKMDAARTVGDEDEIERLADDYRTIGESLVEMLVDAGLKWPGFDEFSLRWVARPNDQDAIQVPDASDAGKMIRVGRNALLTGGMLEDVAWSKWSGTSKELFLTLGDEEAARTLQKETLERTGDRLAVIWRGRVIGVLPLKTPLSNGVTLPLKLNDTDASALERELKEAAGAF